MERPIEPSKELLHDLIVGVCQLCDRTRALVRGGIGDPAAIVPVREALHLVAATLEALSERSEDALPPALPGAWKRDGDADWLLGGERFDSLHGRGDE